MSMPPELAEAAGARVVTVRRKGYGNALMSGIRAARGTYVIMADADDSYDLENLGPFLAQLRQAFALVENGNDDGDHGAVLILPLACCPGSQYTMDAMMTSAAVQSKRKSSTASSDV